VAWKRNILVVANVTATSEELLDALQARARQSPASFTLIVPATPFGGGRSAAAEHLRAAVESLRAVGLEAEGAVGDADPAVAVTEAWDPKHYDEIIVSTLPMRLSKWLRAGLPERIGRLTGAPITHVVSRPPKPEIEAAPVPVATAASSRLGPLSVLAWGPRKP
jgi:hypothetical protein